MARPITTIPVEPDTAEAVREVRDEHELGTLDDAVQDLLENAGR